MTDFYHDPKPRSDGLSSYCRPCKAASARARYRAKGEEIRAYMRRYRASNPHKHAEFAALRRMREKATHGKRISYRRILRVYGRVCHICTGAIGDDLQFDHVIPLSRGGTHTEGNIRPAHASCNMRKGSRIPA